MPPRSSRTSAEVENATVATSHFSLGGTANVWKVRRRTSWASCFQGKFMKMCCSPSKRLTNIWLRKRVQYYLITRAQLVWGWTHGSRKALGLRPVAILPSANHSTVLWCFDEAARGARFPGLQPISQKLEMFLGSTEVWLSLFPLV